MIGALPRADVRSANGQAHIEYTFGVNGTVISIIVQTEILLNEALNIMLLALLVLCPVYTNVCIQY